VLGVQVGLRSLDAAGSCTLPSVRASAREGRGSLWSRRAWKLRRFWLSVRTPEIPPLSASADAGLDGFLVAA
jgi:hypothetical protein